MTGSLREYLITDKALPDNYIIRQEFLSLRMIQRSMVVAAINRPQGRDSYIFIIFTYLNSELRIQLLQDEADLIIFFRIPLNELKRPALLCQGFIELPAVRKHPP